MTCNLFLMERLQVDSGIGEVRSHGPGLVCCGEEPDRGRVRVLRWGIWGERTGGRLGVKLTGEYDGHPSFRKLVAQGYQIITFYAGLSDGYASDFGYRPRHKA